MALSNSKGILYDLDGTIISTIDLNDRGWLEAAKTYGITIPENFLRDQKGVPEKVSAQWIIEDKKDKLDEFVNYKQMYSVNHANEIIVFEDFVKANETLNTLQPHPWICTSATGMLVDAVIKLHPSLSNFNKKVISVEMVEKGKPNPDPLLLAIKNMNLQPHECVYVGDAFSDYQTAQNAGCSFIYYCPNEQKKDPRIPITEAVITDHTQIFSLLNISK